MSTGVTCQVFIDGVKAADGSPGEAIDEPAILEDLAVTWGRSDTMSQPDPDSCTFTVVDPVGGTAFTGVYGTGKRVEVVAYGQTYPAPSAPTFANPGMEGPEVTWAVEGGSAAVSTHRFKGGAKSLKVKPTAAAQSAIVWLGPQAFQVAPTNPDAWDAIPTTADGQSWTGTVNVWLPTGASVSVRAALFSGPYASAGQPAGNPVLVNGNGAWQAVTSTWTVQTDNKWVGFQLVFYPTGPAWNAMPPAQTWDSTDAAYFWDDLGALYIDDAQVQSPPEGSGRGVLVFSGRITDVTASWDESLGAPVVGVSAVGFTADLENRLIGDEPWAVESAQVRAQRIVTLAGLPINLLVDATVAGTLMSWRDVDSQGATGLLHEIATSVDGVLWPAVHQSLGAYLRIEDPALRESLLQLTREDGPPSVLLRRNEAASPAGTTLALPVGAAGWTNSRWFGGSPAAGTHTLIANANDGPVGVRTYVRKQWTVPPATLGNSGDTGFNNSNGSVNAFVVKPGETWVLSAYLRCSVRRRVEFAVQEFNGGTSVQRVRGPQITAPAGVWTRIEMRYTVPATGVTVIQPIADSQAAAVDGNTNWSVGDTIDGTALLMERTTAPLPAAPYFDGSSPDTSTIDYAWVGPVNASASTQSTVQSHTIVIVEGDPDVGINLSACLVLRDPVQWVQDVSDVVTRVSVTWKVQGTDAEGKPVTTDATELVVDSALETTHGTRGVSVSTQLQSAADAANVAGRIVGRTSPSNWRASGLSIDDEDVIGDAQGVALMLGFLDGTSRIGAAVVIGDLPLWSPAGSVAGVYLEGGTYRYVGGRWVLELAVSAAEGLGGSAAWDEIEPSWTWDQWSPAISWNDLRGVSS
jgi:hypothetical protein